MGLISKTAITKWNNKTKAYYQEKGYIYTKQGTEFEVKIADLLVTSMSLIKVKCDYCKEIKATPYKNYNANKTDIVNKYSCSKCKDKKKHEINEILFSKEKLTNNQNGYYTFKINRINKLKNILIKIKDCKFDSLYTDKEFNQMRALFNYYNDNIYVEIEKLGYSIEDKFEHKPVGYYDKFENLEKSIRKFIKEYKHFPLQVDFRIAMNMDAKLYLKHGTINDIKKRMKYDDKNDLIDDNGFCNKSSYEYYVAQFLINNNISYKREEIPFSKDEGKYRSDFSFIKENGDKIYCEVWGYYNREGEERDSEYNKIKVKKIELYKKYNLNLIEINNDIFAYKRYHQINENLMNIFEPILNMKLKHINVQKYIPSSKMTNDELLKEIMKYSKDGINLPITTVLRTNHKNSLYKSVLKRFNNYSNFASFYNKEILK